MPVLEDAQYEVFAQALSRGSPPRKASEEAGYDDPCGEPYKRAARPDVADRVTEIRRARDGDVFADLVPLILDLLDIARFCRRQGSVAAMGTATRALVETAKLMRQLPPLQRRFEDLPPEMTEEEWLAEYGQPGD